MSEKSKTKKKEITNLNNKIKQYKNEPGFILRCGCCGNILQPLGCYDGKQFNFQGDLYGYECPEENKEHSTVYCDETNQNFEIKFCYGAVPIYAN